MVGGAELREGTALWRRRRAVQAAREILAHVRAEGRLSRRRSRRRPGLPGGRNRDGQVRATLGKESAQANLGVLLAPVAHRMSDARNLFVGELREHWQRELLPPDL